MMYAGKNAKFIVAMFMLTNLLLNSIGVSLAVAASQTNVPSGTVIVTQFAETASTETRSVGDVIRMTVSFDVIIGGNVVIKAGAPVQATVNQIKKPGSVGAPGEISVEVRSVQAVDGQMVRVVPHAAAGEGENKQTKSLLITLLCCVLGLIMKGGHAEILSGTSVSTNVSQEITIAVP
jgi:hypothetical protein